MLLVNAISAEDPYILFLASLFGRVNTLAQHGEIVQ